MKNVIRLAILAWLVQSAFALELQGQMVQGGMVIGRVAPGTRVTLNGKSVRVAEDGRFVFGFDRDAPAEATLHWQRGGETHSKVLAVASRKYRIQKVEGIAQKVMQPSADDLKRIGQEAAQVRKARARVLTREDYTAPFVWPLKGPITGVYGSQRVYNGVPGRPHYGVDVAAPVGTPVTTPAPGVVTLAHPDMFYSGGTVIIDHGYGISSTLMHLSKVHVKEGDVVKPGDIVADVGASGRATGPHLDWRMNWFNARIDPQLLVEPMSDTSAVNTSH